MSDQGWRKAKRALGMGAAVLLSAMTLALCHNCVGIYTPSKEVPPEAHANFALMAEAWNTIQKVYVDRSALKPKNMTYGAIAGMVDALGDSGHSAYLTKEMMKEEQEFTEGRYKGVGIELRMEDGHALIVAPLDGSPAQKAGLRSGEIITEVDGKSLIGLDLNQIVKMVLGPAGTVVRLTIFDPETDTTKVVKLTRAAIVMQNVRWKRLPGTSLAQLRIAGLSGGVSGALQKALRQIEQQKLTGIVLDLRDDPGGLLEEAIGSTSQFLEEGNVLLEKNAAGRLRSVPVQREFEATRLPVVVLVNEGTASAAEIIAGALQDAGRAKLVGKRTFGTGTVLQQFKLSDGSALLLAVEEWLTPLGHSIWHKGIAPDVEVNLPAGVRPLLPEESTLTVAKLKSSKDSQLLTALQILSGKTIEGTTQAR